MSEEIEFDSEGNSIPDTVVNKKAYREYIKLKNAAFLRKEIRLIYTSINDFIIDPFSDLTHIKDQLIKSSLEDEEKNNILRRVSGYKAFTGRLNKLKNEAYGIYVNKVNQKESGNLGSFIMDERSTEILEYFGRFLDEKEIKDILFEEWGLDVSVQTLRSFKNKNYAKIKQLKEEYSTSITELKYTHKKSRVEILTKLLDDRLNEYNGNKSRGNYELILKTLREISNIVDTEDINVNVSGQIDHNISEVMSRKEAEELLNQKSILSLVIANAAHKMNVNPEFFTTMLNKSIYARNSGFAATEGDIKEEDILYPTSLVYDMKAIEKKNREDAGEIEKLKKIKEPDKNLDDKRKTLKNLIAEKIKQKQEALRNTKRRIEERGNKL